MGFFRISGQGVQMQLPGEISVVLIPCQLHCAPGKAPLTVSSLHRVPDPLYFGLAYHDMITHSTYLNIPFYCLILTLYKPLPGFRCFKK